MNRLAAADDHERLATHRFRNLRNRLLADTAKLTFGFVELAAGRLDAAADRLLGLTAPDRPRGHRLFSLVAVPDLVEIAARTGRLSEPAEPLGRYAAWGNASSGETQQALSGTVRAA